MFEVSAETLATMDRLERISQSDGYKRVSVNVRPADIPNQNSISVFAYVKLASQLNADEIRFGPLREYELDHASLYRSRSGN